MAVQFHLIELTHTYTHTLTHKVIETTHTCYRGKTNSGAISFKGPQENIHHNQSLSLSCPVKIKA